MDKKELDLDIETQKKIIEAFAKNLTENEASSQSGISLNLVKEQYRKIRECLQVIYTQEAYSTLGDDFITGTYPQLCKEWVESGLISEDTLANSVELFHIVEHEGQVFTFLFSEEMHNKVIEAVNNGMRSAGDDPALKVLARIYLPINEPDCTILDIKPIDDNNTSIKNWTLRPNWFDEEPYEGCEPVRSFCWLMKEVMQKYPSIPRSELEYYLKECEFKHEYPDVNQRQAEVYNMLESAGYL